MGRTQYHQMAFLVTDLSLQRLRKELKIRPGFTPQEDVSRFRGSRQQTLDKTALPKGHIMGWIAPSSETQQKKKPGASGSGSSAIDTAGMSKAAAKNAKRSAKKREEKAKALEEKIREAWDEDDEDDLPPNKDKAVEPKDNEAVEEITEQVDKLNVSS